MTSATTTTWWWALVTKQVRARSTVHRIERSGSGWRTACGRFLPEEPTPAPDHRRRCQMCSSLDGNAWRSRSQPKTFGRALLAPSRPLTDQTQTTKEK